MKRESGQIAFCVNRPTDGCAFSTRYKKNSISIRKFYLYHHHFACLAVVCTVHTSRSTQIVQTTQMLKCAAAWIKLPLFSFACDRTKMFFRRTKHEWNWLKFLFRNHFPVVTCRLLPVRQVRNKKKSSGIFSYVWVYESWIWWKRYAVRR